MIIFFCFRFQSFEYWSKFSISFSENIDIGSSFSFIMITRLCDLLCIIHIASLIVFSAFTVIGVSYLMFAVFQPCMVIPSRSGFSGSSGSLKGSRKGLLVRSLPMVEEGP